MAEKGKGNGKNPTGNPWGHYRKPAASLKRIGDEVVLGQLSNNTVADLQADYSMLLNDVRQLDQYVSIRRKRGCQPTPDELVKNFAGQGVLVAGGSTPRPGYATRDDMERFLKEGPKLFEFARDLMAKAWHLRRSAIDTYLKPSRRKTKKS